MRGFIRFCIQRPVFTGCSVVIWVLLGISSYLSLGVTLYPSVELPFILVQTIYTGAGPNEIEQLVSKPLEDALTAGITETADETSVQIKYIHKIICIII